MLSYKQYIIEQNQISKTKKQYQYHYTKEANEIIKNGFDLSNNSMYGKGVYLTNIHIPMNNKQILKVELKPHNQINIINDYDMAKVYEDILGHKISFLGGDDILNELIDKGIKSVKINIEDNEYYTLILDRSVISKITIL
jgi:hypothetical protein